MFLTSILILNRKRQRIANRHFKILTMKDDTPMIMRLCTSVAWSSKAKTISDPLTGNNKAPRFSPCCSSIICYIYFKKGFNIK